MTENEKRLGSLQLMAYGLYQLDWCADRMVNIRQVDSELGIHGECYACFNEFKENEFLDAGYMEFLLPAEWFAQYRELVLEVVAHE